MVKLASARENRVYGTWTARNHMEYVNASLYLFATLLFLCAFVSQLSERSAKSGLIVLLIALALVALVNLHDLFAHLAGIDYQLSVMEFDPQLALVEFAVPVVHTLGSVLIFLPLLFFFVEVENQHSYVRLEKHASRMFISGSVLWVIGSVHNACQIYERACGDLQILQVSVHIPFLMGSLLFLVGASLNSYDDTGPAHGAWVLGTHCIWLGIAGSLLFLIGAVVNLVKVNMMQKMGAVELERLRNGAEEHIGREREGQVPLILEEQNRRKKQSPEKIVPVVPTPYKDVLLGHH